MSKNNPSILYFNGTMFPVFVGVAFSEKHYFAEVKRLGIKEPKGFGHTTACLKSFTNSKGKLVCIICFDPIKYKHLDKNQVAAVLAHEAVHVSDEVFRDVGEDKPGDETRAYLVQYILQETLYAMDDFLKSKKVKKK